jgi:Ca2+-binding EF-hand superfamily protein
MRKNLLFLAFLAASAGSAPAPAQRPPPPPGSQIIVFISPMGEPFRRNQGPGEPVDRWFQGADTDHDGALTVTEFQADAVRFFATLDVNHDGEIAPDEIVRYETEVAPEVQSGIRTVTFGTNGNNRRMRTRPGEGPFGMGSQALLAIPEPVISADADFNRGISPAEFRHTAGQRFLLVDRNHDGRLTHDELGPPPEEDRRRR